MRFILTQLAPHRMRNAPRRSAHAPLGTCIIVFFVTIAHIRLILRHRSVEYSPVGSGSFLAVLGVSLIYLFFLVAVLLVCVVQLFPMAWSFACLVLHGNVLGVATLMMATRNVSGDCGCMDFVLVSMHASLIFFVVGTCAAR
jgi:hypothetical protein